MLPSKVCTKCKVEYPLDNYTKHTKTKDGKAEICRSCNKTRSRAWYVKNKKKANASSRANQVNHRFGITIDTYDVLLAGSDTCEICEKQVPLEKRELDHNHDTMEIRGVLCGGCNRGLGHFGDCPDKLEKASRYLHDRGNYSGLRQSQAISCSEAPA
jgi:Recombination endonuclease VII